MYLYRVKDEALGQYRNICVPNCETQDDPRVTDELNGQCVYLGPQCTETTTVASTRSSGQLRSCSRSSMERQGYVLGSRTSIIGYLQNETYINNKTAMVGSTAVLRGMMRQLSEQYISPRETLQDALQEIKVKAVAQCLNKYCSSCEPFNLTKCTTCWGRFGGPQFAACWEPRPTCTPTNTTSNSGSTSPQERFRQRFQDRLAVDF